MVKSKVETFEEVLYEKIKNKKNYKLFNMKYSSRNDIEKKKKKKIEKNKKKILFQNIQRK